VRSTALLIASSKILEFNTFLVVVT